MASSRVETQITWSTASSVTLSSASIVDSDPFTIDPETDEWELQISADNAGTPAAGDIVHVSLKASSGDILGDSGDDYDTDKHARYLWRMNTYGSDATGEDPARKTLAGLPVGAGKYKLSINAPQAASRNIVVRARRVELKRA